MSNPLATAETAYQLSGTLDIYNCEALRQTLSDYLKTAADPVLDLSGTTACDLAGLQLLCSARRPASQSGRPLRIRAVPQILLDHLEAFGLPPDLLAEGTTP